MQVPPIEGSIDGEAVSPELRPLLEAVYSAVQRDPADIAALKGALQALLTFLASSVGRTNANCWATDLFFMQNDRWERDWEHLPADYQDLLGDLGSALHDTVAHPEVAENFDNTPEQLLTRLAQAKSDARAV